MRCYECGVEYDEIRGLLRMKNPVLGPYEIDDVDYRECPECSEKLFPSATIKKIEAKENELSEGFLQKLPIADYVKATTAAEMIGISRQAIHKHPKIRRGFIFQIKHEGCWWYLKKSVEKYIATGDGRFSLYNFSTAREISVRTIVGKSTAQAIADQPIAHYITELIRQVQPEGCDSAYRVRHGNQPLISFVLADKNSLGSGTGDDYATAAYSS